MVLPPPPPPQIVAADGVKHMLVAQPRLQALLAGHYVHWIDCPDTGRCTDAFGRDGRSYRRSGDRAPWAPGSCVVHRAYYAMTTNYNGYTVVKALFEGPRGRYLECTFRDGIWSKGTPVTVANTD